jgi:5-methylcytosine-specific restriction endonuclease McrA
MRKAIVERLWRRQRGLCVFVWWCRSDLRLTGYHLDHVVPRSRGGSDDERNLQLTCPKCNLSKGARFNYQFIEVLQTHAH